MAENSLTVQNENDKQFSCWLEGVISTYKSLTNDEKNLTLDSLIANSEPSQLFFLSTHLYKLVHRDFISYLPPELVTSILKFLDGTQILKIRLVCQSWKRQIDSLPDVWSMKVAQLGSDILAVPSKQIDDNLVPENQFSNGLIPKRSERARIYKSLYCRTLKFLSGLQRDDSTSIKISLEFLPKSIPLIKSCYCFDGNLFTGHDRCVNVWSLANGTLETCIETRGSPTVILLCKGSQLYTSSSSCSVEGWSLDNGGGKFLLAGHVAIVTAIDVRNDFAITGSADKSVKIWSIGNGIDPELFMTLENAHMTWISQVYFLQHGKDGELRFISCDSKGFVSWILDTQTRNVEFHREDVLNVGLEMASYCGDLLSTNKTIHITQWNFKSKRSLLCCYQIQNDGGIDLMQSWQLPFKGEKACILGVGSRFVLLYCSISCQNIHVLDLASGSCLVTIRTPPFLCCMFKDKPNIRLCDASWLDGFVFDQMTPGKPVFVAFHGQNSGMIGRWNVPEMDENGDDPD